MSHKYVYLFTEGNGGMRELLGGKGANLAEMTNIGLPVPQGFTISKMCIRDRSISFICRLRVAFLCETLKIWMGARKGRPFFA